MDNRMMINFIRYLSYTPSIFLWNGYWMLSNLQIFGNTVNQKTDISGQMPSSHSISTLLLLD